MSAQKAWMLSYIFLTLQNAILQFFCIYINASEKNVFQGFRREEVRRGLQQPLCRQVEVTARRVFCLRDCIVNSSRFNTCSFTT